MISIPESLWPLDESLSMTEVNFLLLLLLLLPPLPLELLLDFSVFRLLFPVSFSGNLSPRGIISIPAGFFIFNVAASADDTGVIDTEGLISDPILEDDLLTTDEDCDLDEEDVDDEDEVVPPDPDEAGLALKALISR
jgi:hypothetical protein